MRGFMHKRSAFSLLEISVSLVIVGVLAGVLLQFRNNDAADCNMATKSQLKQVETAMHNYVIAHDRFPVPALRTVGVEDTQYGREAAPATLDTAGGVLFGALPFQALNLAPSYAGDCWGNKFSYAVTADLTDSTKFKSTAPNPVYEGLISLKSSATTVLNSKIAYAVISHGADEIGAVKINYSDPSNTQRRWCSGGAGTPIERTNCTATAPEIMAAEFNDGKDAATKTFDDIVIYGGKEQRIVNGQCDNSYALGCLKGSASNDNGQASCSTTRTWHCDGANGGTNDTTCSHVNPVCLNCTSTSLTWSIGCSGTFPATLHGATSAPATTNTNPGFTAGSSATAFCNNGVFSAPVGSCTAVPPPIPGICNNAIPLGCSSGGPAAADNGATSCSSTRTWYCPGLNGGSNSSTCAYTNPACANCSPQSRGWGAGCNASFPGATHGSTTVPVTNANPAYTGTATATCNNGTLTASGSCTPVVPVNGSCNNSGSAPACAAGTVSNDNGDTTPGNTRTWHCDGSGGGTNDTSCNLTNPMAGCSARTESWGSCSGGTPAITEGGSTVVNNTAGGYNGSVTMNCSGGVLTQSGATCDKNPVCGAANNTCSFGIPYNRTYRNCAGVLGEFSQHSWYCKNGAAKIGCYGTPVGPNCFLPDTLVTMADGSRKKVSDLKPGDSVRGHTRINHVRRVPTFTNDQTIYGFNGGKKFVTGGHPFYTRHGWKAIDPSLTANEGHAIKTTKLKVGDSLLLDNGKSLVITSIDALDDGTHDLFNPVMDGDHTYYADSYLVHNKAEGATCSADPNPDGTCLIGGFPLTDVDTGMECCSGVVGMGPGSPCVGD